MVDYIREELLMTKVCAYCQKKIITRLVLTVLNIKPSELATVFPSFMAFKRKLDRTIPLQSIILARYGQSAWNRKYGSYIDRDYEDIICGKVWVSDHAQIDVACMTKDGDVVFPWVTAWRDFKSGKWLGWLLQTGNPNSDHIFQTFYYAAELYGLPEDVIIDNGKDYRCKDFAGGRRVIKIKTNQSRTTSMLCYLFQSFVLISFGILLP